MARRIVTCAALLGLASLLPGCFSLTNMDDNVAQINKYGDDAHEMRLMTNKYFFNYDHENPFE